MEIFWKIDRNFDRILIEILWSIKTTKFRHTDRVLIEFLWN